MVEDEVGRARVDDDDARRKTAQRMLGRCMILVGYRMRMR